MRKALLAALAAAILTSPALAADPVTIKVATFVPEKSTGVAKVIKPWMEAVQAEVGDAVRMQPFWGGTLGKNPFKQYELVKNGVADVTWVLPGYTAGQFPELQAMELPFFAETGRDASIAGWRLAEQGLLSGLEDVHLIGFWATSPSILFTRFPVAGLGDLANKRIRSVGPVHAAWLESVGAAPQTMASTEMNEALDRGILDGVVQGWTGMQTFKSLPLVTHAVDVPVGVIPFLLLMNKATWEALPEAVQAAIMKHGGLAMAKAGGGAYDALADEIRDKAVADGLTLVTLPPEARQAAAADARKIHDDWIAGAANGRAVYDTMKTALGK